jgi:hypothetical protein
MSVMNTLKTFNYINQHHSFVSRQNEIEIQIPINKIGKIAPEITVKTNLYLQKLKVNPPKSEYSRFCDHKDTV